MGSAQSSQESRDTKLRLKRFSVRFQCLSLGDISWLALRLQAQHSFCGAALTEVLLQGFSGQTRSYRAINRKPRDAFFYRMEVFFRGFFFLQLVHDAATFKFLNFIKIFVDFFFFNESQLFSPTYVCTEREIAGSLTSLCCSHLIVF